MQRNASWTKWWELLRILTARNLKIRYKGSVLGFFWSLLTPALTILMYAVFARILKFNAGQPHYLQFLVSGIIVWGFTVGSLNDSLFAIAGNANLVKKVYFPRAILPLTTALANGVNFLLTFVPLMLYLALTGTLAWGPGLLWLLPAFAFHLALCAGIACLVGTLNVFFRDTEHIVGLLLLAWFFMTPVMYEASLQATALARFAWYPEGLHGLVFLNPMTGILSLYRRALMGMDITPPGIAPAWLLLSVATTVALLFLGRAALRIGDRHFGDVL